MYELERFLRTGLIDVAFCVFWFAVVFSFLLFLRGLLRFIFKVRR